MSEMLFMEHNKQTTALTTRSCTDMRRELKACTVDIIRENHVPDSLAWNSVSI